MNTSTPTNSNSSFRERKRAPIACMNCRIRKLKCRSLEPVENSPCERCIKERLFCEYRPVEQSPASNSQVPLNYAIQDNPVNLYPVPAAPPANQPSWFQPTVPPPTSGEYAAYPYYPPAQAPLHANPPFYPTSQSQYQQVMPHPAPQYTYPTLPSEYPTGQPNYQASPQFHGHPPNQPMSYHTPAPAPYMAYRFDNYGNPIDDSRSAKEQK